MGLFSKIYRTAKGLTKIGNGVTNVSNLLDQYEYTPDVSFLYVSAWISRVAIIETMETNEFPMSYSLVAHIEGKRRRMTLYQAYMLSIGRLMSKAGKRSQQVCNTIQEILDKGDAFYKIDAQISYGQKKTFI